MSAKVSFAVTTYFKRPRGESGLTRVASLRLSLGDAVDWILSELPDEAITVNHDLNTDLAHIVIDWSKVPDEIRYGGSDAMTAAGKREELEALLWQRVTPAR